MTILYSFGISKTINLKMEYTPKHLSMGETETGTRMSKDTCHRVGNTNEMMKGTYQ
jgi:hypothetical protein